MNQKNRLFRLVFLSVIAAALGFMLIGISLGLAEEGATQLDNDPDDEDIETYCEDDTLPPGQINPLDEDEDGDFDSLFVGVGEFGEINGFGELDGDGAEAELFVSDPTTSVDQIRSADADGDGDAEVIWLGTKGLDLNGNGTIDPDEHGVVVTLVDIDGDGNLEILVADHTRKLSEFSVKDFDINKRTADPREAIWVGLLNESLSGRAGAIEEISDIDSDGDTEIMIVNIQTDSGAPSFGQSIDVDDDGDADIIIQ